MEFCTVARCFAAGWIPRFTNGTVAPAGRKLCVSHAVGKLRGIGHGWTQFKVCTRAVVLSSGKWCSAEVV